MNLPIDSYTFRARVLPGLLAVLPLTIGVTALAPEPPEWWATMSGIVVACGGTYWLADIARHTGKQAESALFRKWGGKPTTRFLRHRNASNSVKIERYHRKLRDLQPDLHMPSAQEEREDPAASDRTYEAAIDYLKERVRGDALVFQANCEYGFRRNAFGLRRFGIGISASMLLAGIAAIAVHHKSGAHISIPIHGAAIVLDLVFLAYWWIVVSPAWVEAVANGYAERLLATLETINTAPLPPSDAA